MAWSVGEEARVLALETAVNNVQTALNAVATKAELKSLLLVLQRQVTTLTSEIAQLEAAGTLITTLSAHLTDINAHLDQLLTHFYTEAELDAGQLDTRYYTEIEIDTELEDYILVNGTRAFTGVVGGISPTADNHLATKLYIDESIRKDGFTIYVDPTGNDSAAGTLAAPIQTLAEADRRIPQGGYAYVYLGPGEYEMVDYYSTEPDNRNYLRSDTRLEVYGTVEVLDTFTVSSMTGNTITAQGSPGWTIDEWKGKKIKWTGSSTLYLQRFIISNTENTLTVAHTTSDFGGVGTKFTNGTAMSIVDNTSILAPSPTVPTTSTNILTLRGNVVLYDLKFDGSAGNGSGSQAFLAELGSSVSCYGCSFENLSNSGPIYSSAGSIYWCMFKDVVGYGVSEWHNSLKIIGGDLYFLNCGIGIRVEEGIYQVATRMIHYLENVTTGITCIGPAIIRDSSPYYWLSDVDTLFDITGQYFKEVTQLKGISGYDTANSAVFLLTTGVRVKLFNSTMTSALKPNANFFQYDTDYLGDISVSLSEYLAAGSYLTFPGGTFVGE